MVWRIGARAEATGVVAAVTGLADSKVDSISVTRFDAPGIGPKLHCRFLFRSLHYERNCGKYLNPGLAKTGMAKAEAKKDRSVIVFIAAEMPARFVRGASVAPTFNSLDRGDSERIAAAHP
jgi:hypothetical protein